MVTGEGGKAIAGLLAECVNSGNLASIKGIDYRGKGGNLEVNPPHELMDMNALPDQREI